VKIFAGIIIAVAVGAVIAALGQSAIDIISADLASYYPFVPVLVAIVVLLSLGIHASRSG
jgi:hypothetical protein